MRCGSMKLQRRNMCFPENLGENAFSVYDRNYNYADYTSGRKGSDRENKREDAGKKNIFIELGIRFQLQYFGLICYREQKAEVYDEWSKRKDPVSLDFYAGLWPELEKYFNSTPENSGFEQDMTPQREITETHEEDKAEFYLVSVIVSGVREENAGK